MLISTLTSQSVSSGCLGIEDKIWVQVGEGEKIWPIADEDLDR